MNIKIILIISSASPVFTAHRLWGRLGKAVRGGAEQRHRAGSSGSVWGIIPHSAIGCRPSAHPIGAVPEPKADLLEQFNPLWALRRLGEWEIRLQSGRVHCGPAGESSPDWRGGRADGVRSFGQRLGFWRSRHRSSPRRWGDDVFDTERGVGECVQYAETARAGSERGHPL